MDTAGTMMFLNESGSHGFAVSSGTFPRSAASGPGLSITNSTSFPLPITGERPQNAASLLKECAALEVQRLSALTERISEADGEMKQRWMRLEGMRQQQLRREAVNAQDMEGAALMAEMLVDIEEAVRERQTSLQPNGYQAFVFPNKDVYEGQWKNARMHGNGVLRRAGEKDIYEGQWFLGQRNGKGTHHSATHRIFYSGSWVDNKRHGKGQLLEPEGFYSGGFHDNCINGYGEYVFNDGHVYKGEWVQGMFHGAGILIQPSGTKYEGTWARGYEHGRGAKWFFNGDVYVGDWRYGRPHGHGMYTSALFQYEGLWCYGSPQGAGVCVFSDNSQYDGEWKQGQFHGVGCFVNEEKGFTYTGEFRKGKRHGRGEYNNRDMFYSGEWVNDKKNGWGMAKVRELGCYEGEWKDDYPHNEGTYNAGEEMTVWFVNGVCAKMEKRSSPSVIDGSVMVDASKENVEEKAPLKELWWVSRSPMSRTESPELETEGELDEK